VGSARVRHAGRGTWAPARATGCGHEDAARAGRKGRAGKWAPRTRRGGRLGAKQRRWRRAGRWARHEPRRSGQADTRARSKGVGGEPGRWFGVAGARGTWARHEPRRSEASGTRGLHEGPARGACTRGRHEGRHEGPARGAGTRGRRAGGLGANSAWRALGCEAKALEARGAGGLGTTSAHRARGPGVKAWRRAGQVGSAYPGSGHANVERVRRSGRLGTRRAEVRRRELRGLASGLPGGAETWRGGARHKPS